MGMMYCRVCQQYARILKSCSTKSSCFLSHHVKHEIGRERFVRRGVSSSRLRPGEAQHAPNVGDCAILRAAPLHVALKGQNLVWFLTRHRINSRQTAELGHCYVHGGWWGLTETTEDLIRGSRYLSRIRHHPSPHHQSPRADLRDNTDNSLCRVRVGLQAYWRRA